jgi:isopenicillin-N N-acyltransferase-like protein
MEQNLAAVLRYPEFVVRGSPREMGRQIGELARELIREFAAAALERVNLTLRVSRMQAEEVAVKSLRFAEQYSPTACDELRGMAESSGLNLIDLMILQIRNQLRAEPEAGCTSVSLAKSSVTREGPLLAQNWDNDPGLDPFTVVLTRRPTGQPAFINITQVGLVAYIGFSEQGIGVCLNSLPAPSRSVGVPHYFTVRGIYESRSLDEAIHAVRRAERAIPANIMLTTPQGPANLEVTIDDVYVLRDDGAGRITHANHCRHLALTHLNDSFPELIQSQPRQARIDQLLQPDSGSCVKTIAAALRDHDGYPRSLCRHANSDPGIGHWQTVFSVIMEPQAGRMHIARGTPCEHPHEVYELKS